MGGAAGATWVSGAAWVGWVGCVVRLVLDKVALIRTSQLVGISNHPGAAKHHYSP